MEEKSLRVYTQKTFFSKLGTTISKILIPTRVGFNGIMISVKRNNLIKCYEGITNFNEDDTSKKEILNKKYEETYTLYLEALDKYVMDSIYKKVKNGTATPFEEDALSRYYMVIHLKETQYLEYKYRKQKYLLELDYENVKQSKKAKIIDKYNPFYIEKIESLYKGILKNYSIQLADNLKTSVNDKNEIFDKIFNTVEEYIENVLKLKMKVDGSKVSEKIVKQYEDYLKATTGKPDSIDLIERKLIILNISRGLFTHSLPLIVAEQCYEQLLNEACSEYVHTRNERKEKKAFKMILNIIEEYQIGLLSTKIYWDKPAQRENYKKFFNEYKKIKSDEKQKEVLFIRRDLIRVLNEPKRYNLVIKKYKEKLVELGAMKNIKNVYTTLKGKYIKK